MSEDLVISIVVPIFNIESFICDCIDSILSQSYRNIEVILVDDGSTDQCPGICDQYAVIDPRVTVIHKVNGGQTSARIAGTEAATGAYICCVDGDDYLAPDYIERISEMILRYSPDFVCCGYYQTSDKGVEPRQIPYRPDYYERAQMEEVFFPALMQTTVGGYFPTQLWAKAFRRELFVEAQRRVSPIIMIGEDRAVVIPCLYRSRSVVIISDCLYYYRVNERSVTRSWKSYSWAGMEALALHLKKEIDLSERDFREQYARFVTEELFTTARTQFNRREDYLCIRREILKMLRLPIFREAIDECCFNRFSRMKMKELCLRYHWIFLMYCYNTFSNRRES